MYIYVDIVMWCYVVLCCAMWCYVVLSGVMWCYIVLCCVMLCYVVLFCEKWRASARQRAPCDKAAPRVQPRFGGTCNMV